MKSLHRLIVCMNLFRIDMWTNLWGEVCSQWRWIPWEQKCLYWLQRQAPRLCIWNGVGQVEVDPLQPQFSDHSSVHACPETAAMLAFESLFLPCCSDGPEIFRANNHSMIWSYIVVFFFLERERGARWNLKRNLAKQSAISRVIKRDQEITSESAPRRSKLGLTFQKMLTKPPL